MCKVAFWIVLEKSSTVVYEWLTVTAHFLRSNNLSDLWKCSYFSRLCPKSSTLGQKSIKCQVFDFLSNDWGGTIYCLPVYMNGSVSASLQHVVCRVYRQVSLCVCVCVVSDPLPPTPALWSREPERRPRGMSRSETWVNRGSQEICM